jgi:cell division septum initiation protein DivIVA
MMAAAAEGREADRVDVVDVMELLDRLEAMAGAARRVPLTAKVMIEEADLFDLIEALRRHIPQEVNEAKWIIRDRDRILTEAREEAERVTGQAREYVEDLATQSEVYRVAEQKAGEILARARAEADEISAGSREYARDLLRRLQENLEAVLELVRQGQESITRRGG